MSEPPAPWETPATPPTGGGQPSGPSPFDAGRRRAFDRPTDKTKPPRVKEPKPTKAGYDPLAGRSDPFTTGAGTRAGPTASTDWQANLAALRPRFSRSMSIVGRIDSEVQVSQQPIQRIWGIVALAAILSPLALSVLSAVAAIVVFVIFMLVVLQLIGLRTMGIFGIFRMLRFLVPRMSQQRPASTEVRRFSLQHLDEHDRPTDAHTECMLLGFLQGGTLRPGALVVVEGRLSSDGVVNVRRVLDRKTAAAVRGMLPPIARLNEAVKPLLIPLLVVGIVLVTVLSLLHHHH